MIFKFFNRYFVCKQLNKRIVCLISLIKTTFVDLWYKNIKFKAITQTKNNNFLFIIETQQNIAVPQKKR